MKKLLLLLLYALSTSFFLAWGFGAIFGAPAYIITVLLLMSTKEPNGLKAILASVLGFIIGGYFMNMLLSGERHDEYIGSYFMFGGTPALAFSFLVELTKKHLK